MSLKVTTESRENRQQAVTIEVDQDRVDKELHKAARKVAQDYRIPGFRKGKAPKDVLKKRFAGWHLCFQFWNRPRRPAGIEPYNLLPLRMRCSGQDAMRAR